MVNKDEYIFIRAYMPLFVTVAEIYGRKVSKFWKKLRFSTFFGPPCRNPLHDFYGSTPECVQVCTLQGLHIRPHLVMLK